MQHGWLDANTELADDAALSGGDGAAKPRAGSTISSVEPHRVVVQRFFDAGVQGRPIHAALKREHAFTDSYSVAASTESGPTSSAVELARPTPPPDHAGRADFRAGNRVTPSTTRTRTTASA